MRLLFLSSIAVRRPMSGFASVVSNTRVCWPRESNSVIKEQLGLSIKSK